MFTILLVVTRAIVLVSAVDAALLASRVTVPTFARPRQRAPRSSIRINMPSTTLYASKRLLRPSRAGSVAQRGRVACRVRNIDAPQALLFDCDGVLVDTEKDGHRVAFNQTFKELGVPHEWDVETYGRLLSIGGGKERMTAFFQEHSHMEPFKSMIGADERKAFVRKVHELKTSCFQRMIEDGQMPLRPGVAQLVGVRFI